MSIQLHICIVPRVVYHKGVIGNDV